MAYILGLWDGHDSGAALIEDGKIVFAANEERYTKRKLEIKFPYNAISNALEFAGIKPSDVETIAFPTTELTKTISRVFPNQKEAYYKFRRRKMPKPRMERLMHYYKYATTTIGVLPLCDIEFATSSLSIFSSSCCAIYANCSLGMVHRSLSSIWYCFTGPYFAFILTPSTL